jgi:hypothetical protein
LPHAAEHHSRRGWSLAEMIDPIARRIGDALADYLDEPGAAAVAA